MGRGFTQIDAYFCLNSIGYRFTQIYTDFSFKAPKVPAPSRRVSVSPRHRVLPLRSKPYAPLNQFNQSNQ
jgi:hypothetical protein